MTDENDNPPVIVLNTLETRHLDGGDSLTMVSENVDDQPRGGPMLVGSAAPTMTPT